jgi:acyl carrier protein phosphodiesterase
MNKLVILLFILVFLASTFLFSQEDQHASETSSSVPELFDFHEIIYPIWHTAYPEKNYSMLKEMELQVQEGAAKIYSAKLPGILRDKQEEWDKGIAKFRSSVDRYSKAMNGTDEAEMLNVAEELHSDFEMLVRIVKPITKEVDEFHKVLYMIYHHYWPNKNMTEFSKAVDDLEFRAEELNKCVLPKWATDKSDDFMKHSQKLYESTKKLKEMKDAEASNDELNKAIEDVHSNYTALETLFE